MILVRSNLLAVSVLPPLLDEIADRLRTASIGRDPLKYRDLVAHHLHGALGRIIRAARYRPVFVQGVTGGHDAHGVGFIAHVDRIARRSPLVNEYRMLKNALIAGLIGCAALSVGLTIYGVIVRMGW